LPIRLSFPEALPGPILTLEGCAACGAIETTLVAEFNRFALTPTRPDAEAARYDYRLCHRCGIVRLTTSRWRPLSMDDRTLRRNTGTPRSQRGRESSRENDAERVRLDRQRTRRDPAARCARYLRVDHRGLSRKDYLPSLLADRLANSIHAEVLASLIQEPARRVLEIRSRSGSTGASLQRQLDADVSVMALFENQRFAIEQAYGFRAQALLDFDAFAIPYQTTFDVVIANHMFTHIVRPREYFAEVPRHLRPGGYLYLYNEPDDAEYLFDGKSMFNTLKAFHLQALDGRSLTRALAANGFG
jgi:hypothetical protein